MRFNIPLKTVMVLTLLTWPALLRAAPCGDDQKMQGLVTHWQYKNEKRHEYCARPRTPDTPTLKEKNTPVRALLASVVGFFTLEVGRYTPEPQDNYNAKIKGDMTIKGGVANVMAEGTQRAVEWSPTTKTDVALLMGSFGTTLTDKFIAKTPALTRKYKEIPYAGYLEMEHTKKIKLDYLNAIDATAKEKNGSRTITGVTIGGNYRTIHCNPKNCTVGSLNRFSILSGAPMMVPKTMYDAAALELSGADLPVDRAGIWKTVASITWSEDFAKEDVNAASARTRHLADPTAYGKAQTALKTEQVKGDRKLVLNTIIAKTQGDITEDVTVSENDDLVVVTETAVTCTSQGQTDCVHATH